MLIGCVLALWWCFAAGFPPASAQGSLAEMIQILDGFRVDAVHTVDPSQGSWVAMCFDDQGRIYASDQGDRLFRIAPSPTGSDTPSRVEVVSDQWGNSQGMTFFQGNLFLIQHGKRSDPNDPNDTNRRPDALLKIRDTDGDDRLDTAEQLIVFPRVQGDAENWVEHSLHAVIPSPDEKSLYIISGDRNGIPCERSRAPKHWNRDSWDFPFTDQPYSGGWVLKTDLDGGNPEIRCVGLRNGYDIAFNRVGDLFTYDSDLENDLGLPNYRPTAIRHVLSGTECGWGGRAGEMLWSWTPDWEDVQPPLKNIGPGSPTGICFGYGAKFPARYQNALFACDWSYGRMFAVHLTPNGASYSAEPEAFLSAQGLPIADVAVSPTDGALYFLTGGRGTRSAIYRVTYVGSESTAPVSDEGLADDEHAKQRHLRTSLERFHGKEDPQAVEFVWPYLNHPDRAIRAAARAALESQPVAAWQAKALAETEPRQGLQSLLALSRCTSRQPAIQPKLLAALSKWDLASLPPEERRWYLRVLTVSASRHGRFEPAVAASLIAKAEALLPSNDRVVNEEAVALCVGLGSTSIIAPCLDLFRASRTQAEQVLYMKALTSEYLAPHWTPEQKSRWIEATLDKVPHWKGGFTARARRDEYLNRALQRLTESERESFKEEIAEALKPQAILPKVDRPFVRAWTSQDLEGSLDEQLKRPRDLGRGRQLFAEAACIVCHSYQGEGGLGGPDLTSVSGRYTPKDLLENTLYPSRVINEQYGMRLYLMNDGKVITGRTVNMAGDTIMVATNPNDPGGSEVRFKTQELERTTASHVSFMPEGLLNTLTREEIFDLLAYLLQRPSSPR